MSRRQRDISNPHVETTAAPRHQPSIFELSTKTAKRDLEPGRVFTVFHQEICDAQRMRIQRTANRNAKSPKTNAAEILHHGDEPGVPNS
jgi:hypothetical protein